MPVHNIPVTDMACRHNPGQVLCVNHFTNYNMIEKHPRAHKIWRAATIHIFVFIDLCISVVQVYSHIGLLKQSLKHTARAIQAGQKQCECISTGNRKPDWRLARSEFRSWYPKLRLGLGRPGHEAGWEQRERREYSPD